MKLKHGEKAKLCYRYRQFHCIHKNRRYYKDLAEDAERRFDTSNYELNRPLLKENNSKVIGVIKDKLGSKIMKEFLGLRAKAYS